MPKHVVRLLALMGVGLALALVAKWYFTPDSFYRFGHYRADSVTEIAALEPVHQDCALLRGLPRRAPRAVVRQQPQDRRLRRLPRRRRRATPRAASRAADSQGHDSAVHLCHEATAGTACRPSRRSFSPQHAAGRAMHGLPQPAFAEDLGRP